MDKAKKVETVHDNDEMMLLLRKIEGLRVDDGLKTLANSVPIYLKILRSFLKMTAKDKNVMRGFLDSNDIDSFRITIHGYKGVLANIGAMALSDLAKDLEKAAVNGDRNAIDLQFPEFDKQLYSFSDKIAEIV